MKIFVFLDYDGTLVSFKPRPEQARPTMEVIGLLKSFLGKKNFEVAIISGRSMKELEEFFPMKGISLAALHGLEVRLASGKKILLARAKTAKSVIKKVDSASRKKFRKVKGILFQDKKYGFTLHFRNVQKKMHQRIRKEFRELVKEIDKKKLLEVIPGALVLEARPVGWGKGKAAKMLLKELKYRKGDTVFFFGDDYSDEDAFKALEGKALTFLVSDEIRETRALFRLPSPRKVIEFLHGIS